MKHKTQKKRRKSKIVRTANYNCAYVSKMAVLIIPSQIATKVLSLFLGHAKTLRKILVPQWTKFLYVGSDYQLDGWLIGDMRQQQNLINYKAIYWSNKMYQAKIICFFSI